MGIAYDIGMDRQKAPALGMVVHRVPLGLGPWWHSLQALLITAGLTMMVGAWVVAAPITSVMLLVAGTGLVIASGAVPRLPSARAARRVLVIHERGLLRLGAAREELRWDQILEVRMQPPHSEGREDWRGHITTPSGGFDCPSRDGSALVELIIDQARPHVWRRMIDAFDRGGSFSFGAVVARLEGLRVDGVLLPWAQAPRLEADQYTVRVCTDARSVVVKRFAVSFLPVLDELCTQMSTLGGDVAALPRTSTPSLPLAWPRRALPAARVVR